MRIILASGSPRRREILMDMGYLFAILSPSVDELDDLSAEFQTPEAFVLENARLKGDAVAAHSPDALVLSADTTVSFAGEVLNKPADLDEAHQMIRRLSGNTHTVYTGFQLLYELNDYRRQEVVASDVTFNVLKDAEIEAYFERVNPLDKAGAYGIQDGRDMIIAGLEGSFTNVMGLPREALSEQLSAFESWSGSALPKSLA
ncbi:MAG: Maf family protein [Verrucomicrobiota bacterium]